MQRQDRVIIITSSAEAGTLETLPVIPEMELIPHEKLQESYYFFQPEQKVCITSEYSLSSVINHLDPDRKKAVGMLKDKFRFRQILHELFPNYDFKTVRLEEVGKLCVDKKSVIKPVRGIFGTAVRVVGPETDFRQLSSELKMEISKNAKVYPDSVLSASEFLVEDFIEGDEYAVDMFYDSEGRPKIVNIMHHPLPENEAYLHMLYNSSKNAFDAVYEKARLFFESLNKVLKVRNFAMHSELRLRDDKIIPVENNCMRFGGMGLCNLVYYSHGINPFLCFLNEKEPDWNSIWDDRENLVYSFFIAYNGATVKPDQCKPLPDKLKAHFSRVLHEYLFDYRKQLAFGIYFLEEKEENISKLLKLEFDDFFEPY